MRRKGARIADFTIIGNVGATPLPYGLMKLVIELLLVRPFPVFSGMIGAENLNQKKEKK